MVSEEMWHVAPLLASNTHTDTNMHTQTHARFCPGWSELFISPSTSAASGGLLSLDHYKYPQAVENVLTDTGDKRGPACWLLLLLPECGCLMVFSMTYISTFLSYFILDLMKSWVANLKPCRARIILSCTLEDWKYTHLLQHGPFKIYSETF